MQDYRAYILGTDGHRFIKAKDFSSNHPDDAAALSAAKLLIDGHDVGLWDRGRLVARLSPNGEIVSPELAPFMNTAATSDNNAGPSQPASESISLSEVSEKAQGRSKRKLSLLGW